MIVSLHVARERHVRPIFLLPNLELFAQEIESQPLLEPRKLGRHSTRRETQHVRASPDFQLIELDVEWRRAYGIGGSDDCLEARRWNAAEERERDVEIATWNRAAPTRFHSRAHDRLDRVLLCV